MLNNPSHHLRLIFEDVESCVAEIWQDDEALSSWMQKLGYLSGLSLLESHKSGKSFPEVLKKWEIKKETLMDY